jgi:hypothetical protein
LGKYVNELTSSTLTAGKSVAELQKGYQSFIDKGGKMSKVLKGDRKEITKLAREMSGLEKATVQATKTTTEWSDE